MERPWERVQAREELQAQLERGQKKYTELLEQQVQQLTARCRELEQALRQRQAAAHAALEEIYQAGGERRLRDLGLVPQQIPRHRRARHLTSLPGAALIAGAAALLARAAAHPAGHTAVRAAGYLTGAARRHIGHAVLGGAVATVAGGTIIMTTTRPFVTTPPGTAGVPHGRRTVSAPRTPGIAPGRAARPAAGRPTGGTVPATATVQGPQGDSVTASPAVTGTVIPPSVTATPVLIPGDRTAATAPATAPAVTASPSSSGTDDPGAPAPPPTHRPRHRHRSHRRGGKGTGLGLAGAAMAVITGVTG